jgi:single-strand DNA-binding protein
MSSVGLNKWIVSGHLAADAQVKTVDLRNGEQAQLAEATLYVRKPRDRKESFTVKLTIWDKSYAWRKLQYLKKGSVVICTGSIEPNPYISNNGNILRAGLEMTVLDIDLDIVRNNEDETAEQSGSQELNHDENLEPSHDVEKDVLKLNS